MKSAQINLQYEQLKYSAVHPAVTERETYLTLHNGLPGINSPSSEICKLGTPRSNTLDLHRNLGWQEPARAKPLGAAPQRQHKISNSLIVPIWGIKESRVVG